MKDKFSLRANCFILIVFSDWNLRLNYGFSPPYLSPTFDPFKANVTGDYICKFKTQNKSA